MTDSKDLSTITDNDKFIVLIERLANSQDVDVSKLNAMLDFQDRILRHNAEIEANAAFARVVAEMPKVKKNGIIDFSSEKKGKQKPIYYAKFEDIQDIIRPIYEAEGFTLSFDSEPKENGWTLFHAILQHKNGHTRKSSVCLPLDNSGGKQNIQGMGSTQSYGMRYATRNMFNLVFEGEDDDGIAGATTFITDEQAANVKALLEQTNSDVLGFLRMFEIANVDQMPTTQYTVAINMLMAKKKRAST